MAMITAVRLTQTAGGMACGPVEGDTVTEIMFQTEEGTSYFVCVSRFQEFMNVYVSQVPLFDVCAHMMESCFDTAAEAEKAQKFADEFYSIELGEYDEMMESKYAQELKFSLYLNNMYHIGELEESEAYELAGFDTQYQEFELPMPEDLEEE